MAPGVEETSRLLPGGEISAEKINNDIGERRVDGHGHGRRLLAFAGATLAAAALVLGIVGVGATLHCAKLLSPSTIPFSFYSRSTQVARASTLPPRLIIHGVRTRGLYISN